MRGVALPVSQRLTASPRDVLPVLAMVTLLASPFWLWDVYQYTYLLVAFWGLWLIARGDYGPPFTRQEKGIFWAFASVTLVSAVSWLFNDMTKSGLRITGEIYPLLLLFIPIYSVFRSRPFPLAVIWWGFALGSTLAGALAIHDVYFSGVSRGGASELNPVRFGNLATVMTVVVLVGSPYFLRRGWAGRLTLTISTTAGLIAILLSGSRGAWLTLALLSGIGILGLLATGRKTAVAAIAVAFALTVSAAAQIPSVKNRFELAIQQTIDYFEAGPANDPRRGTSVGLRLEAWRASWIMFTQSPLIGTGPNSFETDIRQMIPQHQLHPTLAIIDHAHNEYLSALSTRGILGLASVLAVFILPLALFVSRGRWQKTSGDQILTMLCLAGGAIVISYMSFAQTSVPFDRRITISFYAFSLALVMAAIHHRVNQLQNTADPVTAFALCNPPCMQPKRNRTLHRHHKRNRVSK